MSDPRLNKLAGILVSYSTKVKQDDWVHIDAGWLAKPLVEEIVDHVLKAGGHPTISFTSEDIEAVFLTYADEVQLQWISPLEMQVVQQADVMIFITAPQNTRALSGIDVTQQQTRQAAYREWSATFTERSNSGALRWVMSNFPCPALAQEADMSLTDYEDFMYRATFADQADPLECWQQIHDEQDRLIKWLEGKKKVIIRGPHVDLSFSIEGRRFINSDGDQNMPSGEIFTGPVEDSANGWVTFTYPAINMGREVNGVYLEFERGQVVKATSEKNEAFLLEK